MRRGCCGPRTRKTSDPPPPPPPPPPLSQRERVFHSNSSATAGLKPSPPKKQPRYETRALAIARSQISQSFNAPEGAGCQPLRLPVRWAMEDVVAPGDES